MRRTAPSHSRLLIDYLIIIVISLVVSAGLLFMDSEALSHEDPPTGKGERKETS